MAAARDDFTAAVKDVLARRVAFRCSNPSCGRITAGPGHLDDKHVNIGVAAHITAASLGGPRYDATLTQQQRSSASNGIWLCHSHAHQIDVDLEGHPEGLLRQWKAAAEARARSELAGDGSAALLPRALPAIGIPIKTMVDPFAYEVHRAIEAGPAASGASPLSLLPLYVPRRHDDQLAAVVQEAVDGKSSLAVLVGGSSTGKTRAWWEAVHALPEHWRVWHPIAPARPEALVRDLDAVRPHTVVWLNETQHYFLTYPHDSGELVASRLRELLRDAARAPVLVIGTVWLEYWQRLTAEPSANGPDPHPHARALLTGTEIKVAERFDEEAVQRLAAYAPEDPRLESALRRARDGMVTQYLAGGPALVTRYRTASPAARAVIEAAMDARRLGHGVSMPRSLLERAAPGYMTSSEWDLLDEDWLEQALAYCGGSLRGARGPVTRIRPRTAETADGEPHYRLADYLEQFGRETREQAAAPRSFWDACDAISSGEDRRKLAESARRRGLLRTAFALSRTTTAGAPAMTLGETAELLQRIGRHDDAVSWYVAASDAGNRYAATELAKIHRDAGRTELALDWYRKAALAGDAAAGRNCYEMLNESGMDELAIEWLENVTDFSITTFGNPRRNTPDRTRHVGKAMDVLEESAEAGDLNACAQLAELLAWEEGRDDEAHYWGVLSIEGADGTEKTAYQREWDWLLTHRCTSATSEIVSWLTQRASVGDDGALHPLASIISQCSHDHPDALSVLRRRANSGGAEALRAVVAFLKGAGFKDAAIAWQQAIPTDNDYDAHFELAEMLWSAGRREEALNHFRIAADAEPGETDPLIAAAKHLRDAGRFPEAIKWYLDAAEFWPSEFNEIAPMLREASWENDQENRRIREREHLERDLANIHNTSPGQREEWAALRERLHAERSVHRAYMDAPNAVWRARREGSFINELSQHYQPLAAQGDEQAVWVMCQLAIGAGQHDNQAIQRCEQAVAAGFAELNDDLAIMLARAGRVQEAIAACTRAAAQGIETALSTAAEVLSACGRTSEAERLRHFGWTADYSIELPWEAGPPPVPTAPSNHG